MVSKEQLVQQLRTLGVQPGGVLLVHCAFSKVKPVEGGPMGLINALRAVLDAQGAQGTLVMPSMSYDDEQPFDVLRTPCLEMGVLADTFWRMPGVLRSDSPHAFAAIGPAAAQITAPHPIDIPHGLNSPAGRVYELDGQVLLLGVDHSNNTTVHLCEYMAGVRYRIQKSQAIWKDGRLARLDYAEIDHCCQNFNLAEGWLEERNLQRKGIVGYAEARLMRSRDIVETILPRLRQNETIFLHPAGVDEECDEARASLER